MGGGLAITVEGLEKLGADLEALGRNKLPLAIRRALRGKGGEALAAEMRLRAPVRSGRLVAGIGIHVGARSRGHADDVEVGFVGDLSHGYRGGGRDQLGAWIESGVKPHTIEARNGGSLSIGNGQYERVEHPGFKGRKIASKSIAAAEWEVLAAVVDEIDMMIGGH
jgi:hypothetical protein